MKLLANSGNDRVIDLLRDAVSSGSTLDAASPAFSLFAYGEMKDLLQKTKATRLLLPSAKDRTLGLLGAESERSYRNRLQARWLAKRCAEWVTKKVEVREAQTSLPQSTLVVRGENQEKDRVILGNCPLTTEGLGLTPGNGMSLIQCADTSAEVPMFASWFDSIWKPLPDGQQAKQIFLEQLQKVIGHKEPSLLYHSFLYHIFKDRGEELDEEKIIKTATGIKNTVVWKKLYRFQRDGVVGAIDKLEKYGGCIIADSVGLGKTFEALAIIKYYELRNDRVLVLCPKRLRDNWTLYRANDRRNILSSDRFNYDVLNHTDLSRDNGTSGDIDLSNINWGNYDLLVIDESHNFRNKPAHKEKDTRYSRLMEKVIRSGVKTRVLMLSATPVNNRLADLKNQISFATEGDDTALGDFGIGSIEKTTRLAQAQFNKWMSFEESDRTSSRLLDMLGFDYFKLLDMLTIARSRKHIEKYYGTSETGRFPQRLKPINYNPDVDSAGVFPPIRVINDEIRRLHLAAYAPLRYVLPGRQEAYNKKYNTEIKGGESFFRQVDREESLVHLMRVNLLKRMESAVSSFALTVERQLSEVEFLLSKIENHADSFDEIDIEDIDIDDPAFEPLLVGRKVKVLLQDMDVIRWKQDLIEDRDRFATLLSDARKVGAERDSKLLTLKNIIRSKASKPINDGNKKVIVFTAFADTAQYLYENIAPLVLKELGLHCALVTGTGSNQTTLPGIRKDLASILTSFSPRSKERPNEFDSEGEIDILIATDCISEGQNLQDCDFLVNYDIHWNPVRIIQRFGRIDRIGSPNSTIQLVNFWPNMELDEYINLEQRVSGRMVLLDISATGEENLIEQDSGNQMNDLEYRRKQLLKLQDSVIDLEDLSSGISIADLTLTDFRIDLARYQKEHKATLESLPLGSFAVVASEGGDNSIQPGVFFCLKSVGEEQNVADDGYPLAPYYLVQVGEDGSVLLPYNQAKQILDRVKKTCAGRDLPDTTACARFDKDTKDGENMVAVTSKLATAVSSVVGKKEERAVASLFSPGGTHALKGEFSGSNDFEVISYIVVLPESDS
jgi:SNF2 family DNA or RNA helicase